ncbi:MAG: thioredoxin domain-containing protein [Acidobacteriaceae bacterium]|jgi:protein-disulfide isomerase
MRLMETNRLRLFFAAIAIAMLVAVAAVPGFGQTSAPPGTGETFKDTSMLKPPPGVRLAVIEFQDLQCPACAHAFPIVHAAVAHYNIPLFEHDFPLPQHAVLGSFDAAVWARYLQDKMGIKLADEYRGAVFAAQGGIANKDDMLNFTRRFFQTHGLQMPFVPDPTGQFTKEVNADKALGDKLGVYYTPCIIVCTQHEWVHVTDVSLLYQTIDALEARAGAATPAKTTPAKKATH